MYFSNPRVSIDLDADLIDWIDQIIGDTLKPDLDHLSPNSPPGSLPDSLQETIAQKRTEAIEAAIRNWCQQQNTQRLQRSADLHRQRHNNDETGWLV